MVTTVSEVGEKDLIKKIIVGLASKTHKSARLGDDCGEISVSFGNNVFASTDKVPEDLVAFSKGIMSYFQLGRYLVEVNASDICAMGLKPTGILVNISMPRDFLSHDFRELYEGIATRCTELEIEILGGDTKFSTKLGLVGVAFGQGPSDTALTRFKAQQDELVFISGPLGQFGASLRLLLNDLWDDHRISNNDREALKQAIVEPTCRVDLVPAISENPMISSCMDISDGLGQSLIELSKESNIGIEIDWSSIPVPPPVVSAADLLCIDPKQIVFGPGLDLELVGTVPDTTAARKFCELHGLKIVGKTTNDHSFPRLKSGNTVKDIPGGYDQLTTDLHQSLVLPKIRLD